MTKKLKVLNNPARFHMEKAIPIPTRGRGSASVIITFLRSLKISESFAVNLKELTSVRNAIYTVHCQSKNTLRFESRKEEDHYRIWRTK